MTTITAPATLQIHRAPVAPTTFPSVPSYQRPLPFDGSLALAPAEEPAVRIRPALQLIDGGGHGPTDLERRAGRLVQALVEISSGVRPAAQMSRWMTSTVYDDLIDRLALLGRARSRRGPVAAPRARVVSVRVFQPGERSAEVSARVAHGPRSRALALRLDVVRDERDNDRWTCTALTWG